MISFKQFLNENYQYETHQSPTKTEATFVDESGVNYRVLLMFSKHSKKLMIEFLANSSSNKRSDRTPNPLKVFLTVGSILDEYMNTHDRPDSIEFESEKSKQSRIKLYDRLAKRIAIKYKGKVRNDDSDNFSKMYRIKL